MLGLLLIYFIGKYFYQLAEEFKKNKWGFAVLGVVAYYVGTFIFGIVLAIVTESISSGSIDSMNDMTIALLVFPFGALASYGFYIYLQKKWNKEAKKSIGNIDEIGSN